MILQINFQPYQGGFVQILGKIESVSDGYLGRIIIPGLCIDLKKKEVSPIYSASYCTGPGSSKVFGCRDGHEAERRVHKICHNRLCFASCHQTQEKTSPQVFVHYQKLDEVTTRDSHLLLRIDKCINNLREATVLSTPDANSGYCQIEIQNSD